MRGFANILDFASAPDGLNLKLFPVHIIIIKMIYGLPLDSRNMIPMNFTVDRDAKSVTTETKYVERLRSEGRATPENEDECAHEYKDVALSMGRRSGKSFLMAVIMAWETWTLLSKGCPQRYFGHSPNNVIQLLVVGTDRDQSGLVCKEVTNLLRKCELFKPYLVNVTQSFITLMTPHDLDRETERPTIKLSFKSELSNGLIGAANYLVVIDEAAHMRNAKDVFLATEPSVRTFTPKNPENLREMVGPCEGKVIQISSPLEGGGFFEKMFELGLCQKNSVRLLSMQIPTWEANPTIPLSMFEESRKNSPEFFYQEFGAMSREFQHTWQTLQVVRQTLSEYLAPRLVEEAVQDVRKRLKALPRSR